VHVMITQAEYVAYSLLFFFSSRRRHTRFSRDWSSDVCSSDLNKNRPKIIATRKPIFESIRQQQQEERQALRMAELESIQTGSILEGVVESFESHAAFVRFEHVSGMLRISQVSHHRVDKIEDELTKGQTVRVKVIKKEVNRLIFSIKVLLQTPYESYFDAHKVGETVKVTVVSILPFGVLVELARDVKGLLHKN